MILLIALISFIISFTLLFIVRIYLTQNRLARGDTFFHLLLSDSIRKNKGKYPSSLENVTLDEINNNYNYLAYPPLFHYIVALFPLRFSEKIAVYLNLFIMSLMSSVSSIFVYNLTSSLPFALLSGFIVILNFSALSLVVQFSPRSLGILFYTIIISIATFYDITFFSIVLISILALALILTHKFAIQVLIFGLIPYVILFNELYLLLPLAFGFLLSILVSKGFYIKILKEHLRWLRFYQLRPFRAPIKTYLKTLFA